MREVYAPGCALLIHKPKLADKVATFLNEKRGATAEHLTCCRHEPGLAEGVRVINTCAGCDRRYRQLYEGVTTVSLWEVLAEDRTFVFPDYEGMEMTVHDACPVRTEERVHVAVRKLLRRMNIAVIEPRETRAQSVCCGDSLYGALPPEAVRERMQSRAGSMPREDVVVYCVSCIKAMHIGGRRPRYLVDLLFGEPTEAGEFEPEIWHAALDRFIEAH